MTIEPRRGNVRVFFAGLMVGRLIDHTYELGVLPDTEHQLLICSRKTGPDPHDVKQWPLPHPVGMTWELRITNPTGSQPGVEIYRPDFCFDINRQDPPPDGARNYFCFSWVLDLEDGHDFPEHPRRVPPSDGSLRPLIRVRNGLLYNNKLNRKFLHQQLAHGATIPFGYASDQIGAEMWLTPGQEIALFRTAPGPEVTIFSIPVQAGNDVTVRITNDPTEPPSMEDHRSHFFKYYDAFSVDREHRYDFWDLEAPHHAANVSDARETPSLSGEQATSETGSDPGVAGNSTDLFDVRGCTGESGNPGPLCGTVTLSRS